MLLSHILEFCQADMFGIIKACFNRVGLMKVPYNLSSCEFEAFLCMHESVPSLYLPMLQYLFSACIVHTYVFILCLGVGYKSKFQWLFYWDSRGIRVQFPTG